jgi:hypothetical protein
VQHLDARARRRRADQLAAVRHEHQAGPLGDPERRHEVGGRPSAFVVGEPEADHAAPDVLRREPGQGARVERVPGPVGGDHHGHPDAGADRRLPDRVEHQVGERGDPAEPGGVPRRVDLDLQPAPTVAHVVLGGLPHQPAYVVLGPEHRARDVVEPLEPEPALLVGCRQLRRPLGHQGVGQDDAVALRQLEQGAVPHRAGEVQVQVGLGQRPNVARRPARWSSGPARWSSGVETTHVRRRASAAA